MLFAINNLIMENVIQLEFGLRFSNINVLSYSQYDISKIDDNKEASIEFQSNFQVKILKDTSEIVIFSTINLLSIDTKALLAELKIECYFEVKPFDRVVIQKSENEFQIPDDLLVQLISLSISTIRGILHEKLKGTNLQKEIFPLINPKDLLNKENQNK